MPRLCSLAAFTIAVVLPAAATAALTISPSSLHLNPGQTGTFTVSNSSPATIAIAPAPTACTQNATTLCLSKSRYRITAQWATAGGSGQGQAVRLTDDTGYFWFFSDTNLEVFVKVLNACVMGAPRYWVFTCGLTNVNVVMTVTDTTTGQVKVYTNPLDKDYTTVLDTDAFATCP
jgi:hypothetical protein